MKKSLLALAVLGAFASAASAQSSVTLSGGIDTAIQRTNGDWNFSTGNSGRTNFTLSGREDLGGGMYAFTSAAPRSNHTGGVNVAFADGHVGFLLNNVDEYTMAYLVSINDGQVINTAKASP